MFNAAFIELYLCVCAGGSGENGGEGEDGAAAEQTEETLRRPQVFPKQRSSQGIAGFCDQVKCVTYRLILITHRFILITLSLNRVRTGALFLFCFFKPVKALITCT